MSQPSERRQAIRARFDELGLNIAEWADARGYPRELVYSVLAGRVAGKRGTAHAIAVDLGIKPRPDTSDEIAQQLLSQSRAA